tara:strand:+ start:1359 stop:2843 length:1485 start_codon:yes stop_codon:yes gene_type:complete
MNVLQRKMFAKGDQVKKSRVIPRFENDTLPLTDFQIQTGQRTNRQVKPRGADPQFDSFLDRYGITASQYAEVHGLIEPESGMLGSVTPELFFGPGGLQSLASKMFTTKTVPTGLSGKVQLPAGQQGPIQVKEITKDVTTLSPFGKTATVLPATLALTGSKAVEEEEDTISDDKEVDLVAQKDLDVDLTLKPSTQKLLDEIMGKKKVDPAEERKKVGKEEIDFIDASLKTLQDRKNQQIAAVNKKQQEKDYATMNIFLEEVSAALAESRGDLGIGLSQGAANAAKRMGEEEREDELAFIDALSDLDLDEGGLDLTESNVLKISERYRDAVSSIEKQDNLRTIIGEMKSAISGGNVTGLTGFVSRMIDNVAGFTGIGDDIVRAATSAKDKGEYIQAQAIQQILQESGRTISDRDRQLIKQIVANLENPFMGKGRAEESLSRILNNIRMSEDEARKEVEFLRQRYGTVIPQLGMYDQALSSAPTTEPEYNLDDVITG